MAETRPHVTIGHHPEYGVVAAASHEDDSTDHLLRLLGFERFPDSKLYVLTEPNRDPTRLGERAVQALRATEYSVTSDAAYDLKSYTRHTTDRGLQGREGNLHPEGTGVEAAFVSARALDADIRAAWIVVHDQVRDPEGTLRAVGSDIRTREGVLLHGEGDLRYVETRLDSTALAFGAFSYIRGNGRTDPTSLTARRRAQAAAAISPASAGLPQQHVVEVGSRPPAPNAQQPVRSR